MRVPSTRALFGTAIVFGLTTQVGAQEKYLDSVIDCAALAATLGGAAEETQAGAGKALFEMAAKWLDLIELSQQSDQVENVMERFNMVYSETASEFKREASSDGDVDVWFDRLDDCIAEVSFGLTEEQ